MRGCRLERVLARDLDKPRSWILSDKGIKDLVLANFGSQFELEAALKNSFYIRGKSIEKLYKVLKGNKTYKNMNVFSLRKTRCSTKRGLLKKQCKKSYQSQNNIKSIPK